MLICPECGHWFVWEPIEGDSAYCPTCGKWVTVVAT